MTYISSIRGVVSTTNSSSSTLTASSTFTGTSEDVSHYANISIMVYSDVNSAAIGLSMQFSTDDANWDNKINHTFLGGFVETFNVPVKAQYFRIVYTNGGTGQSSFRLQTIYHSAKNVMNYDHQGNAMVSVNNQKSAFGELYIASLTPLIEIEFVYGIIDHFISTRLFNGGTTSVSNSKLQLTT